MSQSTRVRSASSADAPDHMSRRATGGLLQGGAPQLGRAARFETREPR